MKILETTLQEYQKMREMLLDFQKDEAQMTDNLSKYTMYGHIDDLIRKYRMASGICFYMEQNMGFKSHDYTELDSAIQSLCEPDCLHWAPTPASIFINKTIRGNDRFDLLQNLINVYDIRINYLKILIEAGHDVTFEPKKGMLTIKL